MPVQKNRDGRSAFFNLKLHYLGVNNVDIMAATAEKKLQTNSYSGETRKWNFEKYVRVHVDQHAILNGLMEHGYAGIDKQTMVRYLTTGIKTPSLDHVKTRILSDAGLRENFPACVNLFQDFITQKEAENPNITIATVNNQQHQPKNHKSKRHDNNQKAGGRGEVSDRYYVSLQRNISNNDCSLPTFPNPNPTNNTIMSTDTNLFANPSFILQPGLTAAIVSPLMWVRKELEEFILSLPDFLQPIATHGSLKSLKLYADLQHPPEEGYCPSQPTFQI